MNTTKTISFLQTCFVIALIALATLLYELTMIRVLDVLWFPHMAYMVITLALLGFGIAGVISSIIASKVKFDDGYLFINTLLFALSLPLVYLVLNNVLVDFELFSTFTSLGIKTLIILFAVLLPFLFSGLVLTSIFSRHSESFGRLYFWDLAAASAGVFLVPLLIPTFGGPGLIFLAAGIAGLAVILLAKQWLIKAIALILTVASIAWPLSFDSYLEINFHMNKRDFRELQGGLQVKRWDPISRIDIIQYREGYRWIAYDGGTQTSYYYKFNGDYETLRNQLPEKATSNFWERFVFAAAWLKEGNIDNALVIGAAGGQETKAMLTFGAKHVDAVEMVGTVLEWGRNHFAKEIYRRPEVSLYRDEGRSFLRSSGKKYDIIQMMSNHTSSSISSGSGAVSPHYLQTVDAYEEYYSHLTEDGILQINHHVYPRMIATAARAWKQMGFTDFQKHVVVYENKSWFTLPTMLIKMSPWTKDEIDHLNELMLRPSTENKQNDVFILSVDPTNTQDSALPQELFSGEVSDKLIAETRYNMWVPTDDRPFFNHLRRTSESLEVDEDNLAKFGVVHILNRSLRDGVPMDVIHLFITIGCAFFMAIVGLFLPLLLSDAGKQRWPGKAAFIGFFACLGAGFISIELIFIQLFHKLIGFPIYTYVTVIASFLVSAGIGSLICDLKNFHHSKFWSKLPFIFIPLYGVLLLLLKEPLLSYFLSWSFYARMLATAILIFPLGFFMGMPFPLGIARSHKLASGIFGWAWAINGFFTVFGGAASLIASLYLGFTQTLIICFLIYFLAGILFTRIGSRSSVI